MPSSFNKVVKVCTLPLISVTNTVITEPAGASSTLPTNVGVVSLVSAIAVTVISGFVKSTTPWLFAWA